MPPQTSPKFYAITFQSGRRTLKLYCRRFGPSEHDGLFQIADIVFSSSRVLLHEEELLRAEFQEIERLLLPTAAILRVDEMKPGYQPSEGPGQVDSSNNG